MQHVRGDGVAVDTLKALIAGISQGAAHGVIRHGCSGHGWRRKRQAGQQYDTRDSGMFRPVEETTSQSVHGVLSALCVNV
jgi:hypothetical protein